MQIKFINPFIASLTHVFRTMLDCQVRRGKVVLKDSGAPKFEVSGIVGLSSQRAAGTIVLSLSQPVALKSASVMLLHEITQLNADVVDAVGELTNVVAGAGKADLEEYALVSGLPNVITGRDHEVRFPSEVTPVCVPFDTDWGPLALEVGFAPIREPVSAAEAV